MSNQTYSDLELHQLVLEGNDLALARLYDTYGGTIVDKLIGLYNKTARTDISLIYEAVSEAFWGYFRNPSTFDPQKKLITTFPGNGCTSGTC
jgi:hypothetical protein